MPKKVLIVAQLCITFCMAVSMSGIMSLIAMGPSAEWLAAWPIAAITAWPIAFILTQFFSRFGFFVAHKLVGDGTQQH
jgi:hypothetical protein